MYTVDPAESSTSSEGIGEGGRGLLTDANFFLAERGKRKKGSHSLEGLGDSGHAAVGTLGGRLRRALERGEGGGTKLDVVEEADVRFEDGTVVSSQSSTKSSSNVTQSCVIRAASSFELEVKAGSKAGRSLGTS